MRTSPVDLDRYGKELDWSCRYTSLIEDLGTCVKCLFMNHRHSYKDPMLVTKRLSVLALCSIVEARRSGNLRKRNAQAPRELSACADNESSWKLDLTVDDYPWETRWTVKDTDGNKVAYGPADNVNYEKRGTYEDTGCLPTGDYVFTMKDRSGDGLCCEYGEGKYQFRVDDNVLAESDGSAFKMLEFPFVVEGNVDVDNVEINNPVSSETGETDQATDAPSTPNPTNNNPTNRPTAKPTPSPTVNPEPTETPSFTPTTSPTALPSESPVLSPTTMRPTTKKPSESPSSNPTSTPSTSPTMSPSKKPTNMPVTPWPTYEPSGSPTVQPSSEPSAAPSTDSPSLTPTSTPSASPTISPSVFVAEVPEPIENESSVPTITQSEFPSQTLSESPSTTKSEYTSTTSTELPSTTKTEELTVAAAPSLHPSISPSTARLIVPITPFSLFLTTNETEIDLEELDSILTDHLMKQLIENLPKSTEVSKVDLLLTDTTPSERKLKKDEKEEPSKESKVDTVPNENDTSSTPAPTEVQEAVPKTTTHEVSVSGDAFFAGSALPTTEQLDDVTSAAFEGDAGNEFIQSLLSADDPGLQSTIGVSVPIESDVEFYEGFLFNKETQSPPTESSFNLLYVVGAVFVVGLLLVAAFVHRTRNAQRNRALNVDDFVEEPNDVDEDGDDLPTFIEVIPVECEQCENDCDPVVQDCAEGCGVSYCFIENIHEAPSQASTEVASNQTYSMDTTRQYTLDTKGKEEELVTIETHADGSSNNRSLQPTSLYQIHEYGEDTNQNTGLFCGLNHATAATKADEKSRFGMESQWGLKPTDSQDTSAVQNNGRCSTACN